MSYEQFADVYDRLQYDVDYEKRALYLAELFMKYDRLPTLLLDVACGTGGFSVIFAKMGVDVIGADPSPEMLDKARQKLDQAGQNVLLLCQSAEELDLYGTVDGAICCLDSLNHIIDEQEFKNSIKHIALFLEPQRLFIFDVNTVFKHKSILSGNTFVKENDGVFCVWQNSECDEENIVDIELNFFTEQKNGSYLRTLEQFSERAYSVEFINEILTEAGLETVAVLGDMSDTAPKEDEERIIFVTRKV